MSTNEKLGTCEWPYLAPDDEQCPQCVSRCIHDYCECCEDVCPECMRLWNLEKEAEREANWQKNVIGPMLGFTEEFDEH